MVRFIETNLFLQLREDYLPDDEYARPQEALIERPERGALIPGSGGVRKCDSLSLVEESEVAFESFTTPRFARASCLC